MTPLQTYIHNNLNGGPSQEASMNQLKYPKHRWFSLCSESAERDEYLIQAFSNIKDKEVVEIQIPHCRTSFSSEEAMRISQLIQTFLAQD